MSGWKLEVYDRQQRVHEATGAGRLEIGRQDDGEPAPYVLRPLADRTRLVVAPYDEIPVSRKQVVLTMLKDGRFRLENTGRQPVRLPDGGAVEAGGVRELAAPVVFLIGRRTVRVEGVEPVAAAADHLKSLVGRPPVPGEYATLAGGPGLAFPLGDGVDLDALFRWLQAAMGVLQSGASAEDFFTRAARAVVDLVGLDSGRVLLWEGGEWRPRTVQFAAGATPDNHWEPSRQVLDHVRTERRTFWELPPTGGTESLLAVDAVVAAPLLNRSGAVVGVLYGDRRQDSTQAARPIGKLDALLVELLASGVAAGLDRVAQEEAAARARVLFEQFFTPELSRHLATHPNLLDGHNAEVSVLFCDVRSFSRISEHLGPEATVAWVGDVMDAFSECVLEHGGVLVDYIGDELIAMWGAPEEQADHATRACRSALAMLARLPALNARWQAQLGESFAVGIGVNSGPARVGNTGSKRKFKYGPLGNTVNLASRVQGATKHLRTRLLVTRQTHAQLGPGFAARRLCDVRVVNIAEPVGLYELADPAAAGAEELRNGYEQALALLERDQVAEGVRSLGALVAAFPEDGPAQVLLARALDAAGRTPARFTMVWDLPGK